MQLKYQCEPGFNKWHHKSRLQNSRFFLKLLARTRIRKNKDWFAVYHKSNLIVVPVYPVCPLLYPNKWG